MAHAPGMTIRNSTFTNCSTMDISLGRGDWWGQPPYGNVVLENNVFGHSTHGGAELALLRPRVVRRQGRERPRGQQHVRERGAHRGPAHRYGPYSGVWANNIGDGWECLPGVTYAGNVGQRCGGSDRAVRPPAAACRRRPARPRHDARRVGDPANHDFHLTAGSPAIDAGSAQYAPTTDQDGKPRNGAPDAGAHEL